MNELHELKEWVLRESIFMKDDKKNGFAEVNRTLPLLSKIDALIAKQEKAIQDRNGGASV